MNTLQALHTRRSIRKYLSRPVEEEKVKLILESAMLAPSARNTQPWHFIVVNERQILNDIATFHPHAKMLFEAPLAIVVCADINLVSPDYPEFWIIDCAAAIENMLVAATELELGSIWLGVHPRPDRRQSVIDYFKLPDNIQPHSIIGFGYTDLQFTKADRFQPERIHLNKW